MSDSRTNPYYYRGLSAERASRKAQELVERTAAGGMGWLALADHLVELRAVYQIASRVPGEPQ